MLFFSPPHLSEGFELGGGGGGSTERQAEYRDWWAGCLTPRSPPDGVRKRGPWEGQRSNPSW